MTTSYLAASSGATADLGFIAPLKIGEPDGAGMCRARVSIDWVRCAGWLGDGSKVKSMLVHLPASGVAICRPHTPELQSQFDALLAHSDAAVRSAAGLTLFQAKYLVEHALSIPAPVAAHITGQPGGVAHAWAWAFGDHIELWNNAVRAERTMEGVAALAATFP